MVLEKTNDAAMLPRSYELPLEARLQGDGGLNRPRCASGVGRALRTLAFRYRRDLYRKNKDAQANE